MLQQLLMTLLLVSIAVATPFRRNCAEFQDCISCATHLSWLGTPCRWCPIDRGCHEMGSLKNKCTDGHNIQDPSKCSPETENRYSFNPALSYYAAILSGAAYAPSAAECVTNFLGSERLSDVKQVDVNCDSLTNECSAFVGRSSSKKLLIVSFRGTHGSTQLMVEGLMSLTVPKQPSSIAGKVQQYFNSAFSLLWQQLLPSLRQLLQRYGSDHKVLVTGHSLGGAMAALAAVELATFHSVGRDSLVYYTFGEPRVGDFDFASAFDALVPNAWRVVHANDVVVHLPICSPVVAQETNSSSRSGSSSSSSSNMAAHQLHPLQHFSSSPLSSSPFSCSSRFGLPYHHGTEIFFPRGVSMRPDSQQYRVCRGVPINEDATCANSSDNWRYCFNPIHTSECIHSHVVYYGIHLGNWWDMNQCKAATDPAF